MNILIQRNKKLAAVVVTFLVFEAFRYMTQSQLQFQLIDLRLLFVVLISTVFGHGGMACSRQFLQLLG